MKTELADKLTVSDTYYGDVRLSTYDAETDAYAVFDLYPREARKLARKLLKLADEVAL